MGAEDLGDDIGRHAVEQADELYEREVRKSTAGLPDTVAGDGEPSGLVRVGRQLQEKT